MNAINRLKRLETATGTECRCTEGPQLPPMIIGESEGAEPGPRPQADKCTRCGKRYSGEIVYKVELI